jgi:MerR family mercuric resistance operon transcriptional regulator
VIEMPATDIFAIGVLSRRSGVNIETIRYYERTGLLRKPARSAGGFRLYSAADAVRLGFIRRARDLGFSLDEVRRLLALADGKSQSCQRVQQIAEGHLADVRAKLADLRRMERVLAASVKSCAEGNLPECPLLRALAA